MHRFRTGTTLALALSFLLAGCADAPAGSPTAPATSPAKNPPPAALYGQARDVAPATLPADGHFEVPAGATGLHAYVYGNSTADCWELHGPAPPRPGEVFPNPFIDLIAPSGRKVSLETSLSSGCEETAGGPLRGVDDLALPDEAGAWTVHHDWLGQGVRVTVVVRPPPEE
jgi:hypothetical protein